MTCYHSHKRGPGRPPGPPVVRPFPTRWATVISLEMRGMAKYKIAEQLQLSPNTIVSMTNHPLYIAERNRRLAQHDEQFLNLRGKAVEAVSDCLEPQKDDDVRLKAAEMWFKANAFGGYAKNPPENPGLTAEDVVSRLLNVNVNVAVGQPVVFDDIQPQSEAAFDDIPAEVTNAEPVVLDDIPVLQPRTLPQPPGDQPVVALGDDKTYISHFRVGLPQSAEL